MVSPPDVTEQEPSGRWALHQGPMRLLGVSLVVLALVIWWRGLPQGAAGRTPTASRCAAPVPEQVADWGTSSTLLLRARMDGVVELEDGPTRAEGWRVMVRSAEATAGADVTGSGGGSDGTDGGSDGGADGGGLAPPADAPAAGSTVLLWPAIGQGRPVDGEGLLVWVNAHDGTTLAGSPAPGFDAVGMLAATQDAAQRICPDSRSATVPLERLTPSSRG
ncbi:MAG: hypothetical protein U0Q15_03565 [Kineosporiaceae bacterium]